MNPPLFRSHIKLAHHYWKSFIQPGYWIIDATCGNGKDTLFLAKQAQIQGDDWGLLGIDIQEQAISHTQSLLKEHLPQDALTHIHLYHDSHESFPSLALEKPILLIVYNLGYLPGSSNKLLTTKTSSTLKSIQAAQSLLQPGGLLSIMCYPGHEEGARETQALESFCSTLCPKAWHVYFAPLGFVNLDAARQSKIDPNERDHCTPCKASEKDQFGKVAASPNSQIPTERSTTYHTFLNKKSAPRLLLIQKNPEL